MKYSHSNRGYTLLFATLTAAVVLGVAIFITSTSRKQFILASTARDSMFSIYNADSALECAAVGWISITASGGGSFNCNGSDIYAVGPFDDAQMTNRPAEWSSGFDSDAVIIPFESAGQEKGCAKLVFIEGVKNGSSEPVNVIEARGYNLGNASECPKIGPRTVERALRVTYE